MNDENDGAREGLIATFQLPLVSMFNDLLIFQLISPTISEKKMRKMVRSSPFLSRNWGNSPFLRYSFRVVRVEIICFNRCFTYRYVVCSIPFKYNVTVYCLKKEKEKKNIKFFGFS